MAHVIQVATVTLPATLPKKNSSRSRQRSSQMICNMYDQSCLIEILLSGLLLLAAKPGQETQFRLFLCFGLCYCLLDQLLLSDIDSSGTLGLHRSSSHSRQLDQSSQQSMPMISLDLYLPGETYSTTVFAQRGRRRGSHCRCL